MVPQIMPGVFDSEALKGLQEIFDFAWREIVSKPDEFALGESPEKRRNDLAEMIMLAHQSGFQHDEIVSAILGETARTKNNGEVPEIGR